MSQQSVPAPASTTDPKNMPKAYWWGLGFGALGFVVSMSGSSTKSVNGVMTECSYFDVFPVLAALVCVGCAVGGLVKGFRAPAERSIHPALLLATALVLLVLALVHALRGFGIVGGPC